MVTHKQLRLLMLIVLLLVAGMIAADFLWFRGKVGLRFFFIYWGICFFLAIVLLTLAWVDLRYLQVRYLFQKRKLLHSTMTDEEFIKKLKELDEKKKKKSLDNRNQESE